MKAVVILLLFTSSAHGDDCGPEPFAALNSSTLNTFLITKNTLQRELAELCRISTASFLPRELEITDQQYSELLRTQDLSLLSKFNPRRGMDAWTISMLPSEALREQGLLSAEYFKQNWHFANFDSVEKFLRDPKTYPPSSKPDSCVLKKDRDPNNPSKSEELIFKTRSEFQEYIAHHSSDPEVPYIAALKWCTEFGESLTCAKNVQNIAKSVKLGWFAMPDLTLDVITNPKYEEALRISAIKMLDAYHQHLPSQRDLFSDLKTSFLHGGAGAKEAEDMTYNTLAVISSAGPNIGLRLACLSLPESSKITKVALSLIAQIAPVLDARGYPKGKPYSFPPNVQAFCDSGKSYHFWFQAYSSYKASQATGNQRAAIVASAIVGQAYQMRSPAGSRDPSVAFTAQSLSMINNRARIDMGYAFAGAIQGAFDGSGEASIDLDVDKSIKAMIGSAQYLVPLKNSQEAEAYWDWKGLFGYLGKRRWEKIFAPRAGFDALMGKVDHPNN